MGVYLYPASYLVAIEINDKEFFSKFNLVEKPDEVDHSRDNENDQNK